jgi:hypothetical protein
MKTLGFLLLMTGSAFAQQVNNATINITGNSQNIIINQTGANHSVNINSIGNDIPISVTQSGLTPQSFSLDVTCVSSCSTTPYVVNQY